MKLSSFSSTVRVPAVRRFVAVRNSAKADVGLVPAVKIDNRADSFATVVTVEYQMSSDDPFLADTITTLKNLGLNVVKARIAQTKNQNVFYVTESTTSDKLVKSAQIEELRQAILDLLSRKPDAGEIGFKVSDQSSSDPLTTKLGARKEGVNTKVTVSESPSGTHSLVLVVTTDRPGLLTDVVRVMKDLNLNVVSAEIETVGNQAIDTFFVTHRGEALSAPMKELTVNALQYYLQLREVETVESY